MNSEQYFGRLYARAARLLGQTIENTTGIILSVDVGGSFFDCLLSNLADAFGHQLQKSPSLFRHRARILDSRQPIKPADVIQEPFVFGRTDGWLHRFDPIGSIDGYALEQGIQQIRSIDSWSSGRGRLRLIHFGDGELLLDQVRGASTVLWRDRPAVSLYPPALQEQRMELLSQFAERDYRVADLEGETASGEASSNAAEFGWIALPAEAAQAAERDRVRTEIEPLAPHDDSDICELLARQRRSREIFGQGNVSSPALSNIIPVADQVVCNDCYPMEADGKNAWRWLGPGPRSRLAVARPFPGSYRLEVNVLGCRTEGGLSSCRVLVSGREVPVVAQGEERGKLVFVGRVEPLAYEGFMEIDFVSRGCPPAAGADPRTLRLNLGSISVSPCH